MKKLIAAAALAVAAPLIVTPVAQAAPAPQAQASASGTVWEKIATYSSYSVCVANGQWWKLNEHARAYKCVNVAGTPKYTLYVTWS